MCFSSFLYIFFTLYTELSVSRYGITEQLSTGTGTHYSMYLFFVANANGYQEYLGASNHIRKVNLHCIQT